MFRRIKSTLGSFRRHYRMGRKFAADPRVGQASELTQLERQKPPGRQALINYLLGQSPRSETRYLEIGVRNPSDNFAHIQATHKHSVDPGVEFESNPVEFPMTSDAFFEKLRQGQVLTPDARFDVIFIDGLHLADQAHRDIVHALDFLTPEGFVVVHDCNPATQWHAREDYGCQITPARRIWNGTTWKAFVRGRQLPGVQSGCVDSDWGLGVLCRHRPLGTFAGQDNPFYEYHVFESDRQRMLNLMTFDSFRQIIEDGKPAEAGDVSKTLP